MSSEAENIFTDAGAVLHGHFLLTSGRHSPVYWEKFRVLESPRHVVRLCSMIADRFRNSGARLVAGPTTGGILLALEVARQMDIRAVYAEKEGGARVFRRGHGMQPGDKVLIVDDVITTGSSVQSVIDAVRASKGEVTGIGVLVDRSDNGLDFNFPFFSCLRSPAVSHPANDCPLCKEGKPLTRMGGA